MTATASPPRRRRRRTRLEDGRRLASAGHGIAVAALALLIGMLLNAPGVHKRAFNLQAGWQRDVALAFTGPLDTVSGALRLDRPRAALQAATGRSGEDEIDTTVAIGPAPGAPAVARVPSRPTRPVFDPSHPLRLWIAGDSLSVVPGYAILRAVEGNAAVDALGVDGHIATGLVRPDVFNWFTEVRAQMQELHPDVVVLSLGGNDDKDYMTGLPDGVSLGDFGSVAWRREYARRAGGIFDLIARAGGHTIWIGLPQTADRAQTNRFDIVNAAVYAAAEKRTRTVTYLDTYRMFAGPGGGYAEYLDAPDGRSVKVRAGDGVHFEPAGGDMIAREVVKALDRIADVTSWQKRQAAGARAASP